VVGLFVDDMLVWSTCVCERCRCARRAVCMEEVRSVRV